MQKGANLTEGSITRGIVLFALPVMLTNLFQQLYNAIDSAVVGSFAGDISLAAVGSTAALINMLIGFFLGIATGAGVLYAMRYGAKDWQGLKKICDASLFLALAAGLVITVLGIWFTPAMLRLIHMPEDVMPEATIYLRIFLAGTVPNLVYNVASGMIRAGGDSVRPLIYLAVSGLLNLVMDLLLVAWLHMGAAGAALATVLAQLISCVLSLAYMMRMPPEYRFRPFAMELDRAVLARVLRVSVPCGLQASMFNISNLLVQVKVNAFGAMAMAGTTAFEKLDGFIYMPMNAFALTVSTYVGQNIGAGQLPRVKQGIKECLLLSGGVAVAMGAIVFFSFTPAIGLFTDSPEAVHYAYLMMLYMAPTSWTYTLSDILGGAMRGAGAATPVMFITAMCICVFRIIWLSIVLRFVYDIQVVFACYAVSWILSSAVMTWYYYRRSGLKKLLRSGAAEAPECVKINA